MKSLLTILIITSFLGVAVFGYFSMIIGVEHGGFGCIANALGRSAFCPNNVFDFIVFHLDAFKYFVNITFGVFVAILIVGMIFSILPKPLDPSKGDDDDDFVLPFSAKVFDLKNSFKEQFHNWVSLHINSPAFALATI
jgi:hypothetical protein